MIKGNKHLKSTLAECAWGETRKKEGYLKRKYLSLRAKKGSKKALCAVAHKMIISIYHVMKDHVAYQDPVLNDNPKRHARLIKNHINKLKELGVSLNTLSGPDIYWEAK